MIEFKNISKSFKKNKVLDNISMTINDGELVCIIGESGCGKTTLLKMVNYLVKPTSGKVIVNNTDISNKNFDVINYRRNIGYVVQSTGLFPHMTIKQNIELIPKIKKIDKLKIENTTKKLMKMVGLDYKLFKDRYPTQLSGGQQQRIGVVRALAINPDIILMDEPFSALDPMTRSDLQDELLDIQDKFHKTIVFVTHDMDEAIKLADKICIMRKGNILQYDTPENILKFPKDDYVEDFVGRNRIWNSIEYIKAKDIMIKTPITASSNRTIKFAIKKMRENNVDSLIVIDNETMQYKGIIRAKHCRQQIDQTKTIGEVMKTSYATLQVNDEIINALNIINNKKKFSTIPILDGEILKGVITKGILLTAMSQQYFDVYDNDDDDEISDVEKEVK